MMTVLAVFVILLLALMALVSGIWFVLALIIFGFCLLVIFLIIAVFFGDDDEK